MLFSNYPKRKDELFMVKPIKRSNYFKNLEKERYERLKVIEEEKVNILIEKILRTGRVNRDYSIFNRRLNDNNINKDKISKKENIFEKNFNANNNISNFHYKNKKEKKSGINISSNFHNNNKIMNKMSKETFITRNLDRENFLSIIGDDIINANYVFKDRRKKK